jgi:glc operon protein GlcG
MPSMTLQLPTRRILTLEAARLAMAACEAEAIRGGWKVVIAIVDEGGHPLMLHRLDGAQSSSIDTAVGKARAAVAWKRPTRLLEEMVNNGRFAFLSIAQGMALLQGGVPLEIDGQVVGAIGVSGVKASDDEVVATAGIQALQKALS